MYNPDFCKYTGKYIIGAPCYCKRHRFERWSYMTWRRNWIVWLYYKLFPKAQFPAPWMKG